METSSELEIQDRVERKGSAYPKHVADWIVTLDNGEPNILLLEDLDRERGKEGRVEEKAVSRVGAHDWRKEKHYQSRTSGRV